MIQCGVACSFSMFRCIIAGGIDKFDLIPAFLLGLDVWDVRGGRGGNKK